jgi:hypothetical protein
MRLKKTQEELNKFAKYVVQQSKSHLTKGKKNASKQLYNSLDYDVKIMRNSFSLGFIMEEYGMYQDKGVSGIKVKYNTPYKYTNKMPPASAFSQWTVRKGIAPREKGGQFSKRKGLQFAIAKSIFEKGIKPSLFFTKPFEKAFKRLPDDIIEAFELDIEQLLEFTTR